MVFKQSTSRQNNNFNGPKKGLAREHNLAIVRGAPGLLAENGQLRCDWVELAGESVSQSIALLEGQGLMRPGGFIGVDNDPALIVRLQLARPDLKWLTGDLRHHIAWLCTNAEVGVLNFDGYLEVGSTHANAIISCLRPLIIRGIDLFGSFVLILNNCLDSTYRRRVKPSIALRLQTEAVVEGLQGYYPRRKLQIDTLLPHDPQALARIDNKRFEGPLGAYWIYTNKRSPSMRMAKLGLCL